MILMPVQQAFGGTVHKGDPPFCIQPDNTRGDRAEHRIKQAATAFNLLGVVQQNVTLPFQLAGHLVEIPPQHGDFVVALFFHHLHIQVTRADALCRPGQPPDRARQSFRKPQPQPDCRQNQNNSKAQVNDRIFKQPFAPLCLLLLIKPRRFLCVIQQGQQIAIHHPADVQEPIQPGIQPHQSAHFIVGQIGNNGDLVGVYPVKIFR